MKMKAGILVVLMVSLVLGLSSAADFRWRKTASFGGFFSRAASSIVFPVHGNVYPVGYYNVTINIGQPSRPYYLDLDTGSDLTWLQCDAPCVRCVEAPHPLYEPSNDLIPCNDPLCKALHSHGNHRCETPDQCDYEVEYADGGSSLGVLVRDVFSLNYTNGARLNPRLALGCGYDQIPGSSSHPLDGVLGLGRGKVSILSQLHSQGYVRNVIGHCLSSLGGGFLFLGNDLYDSSRVSWTPMSREYSKHYSPAPGGELLFGGKTTGLKNLLVVFDSGSSYTYFNSKAYQAVTYLLKRELSGKPLKEARDDHTLPLCWQGRRPFLSIDEVRKYFKPLSLSFKTGWRSKTLFEITPEAYLIISVSTLFQCSLYYIQNSCVSLTTLGIEMLKPFDCRKTKGNICLGILNGTEIGLQNLNLIGDISMQDQMVIYDNEKQAIGWMPANCNEIASLKASEVHGY